MDRPKYKEMYLEQKARADRWAALHTEINKTLEQVRKDGVTAAQSRATWRADYATLHARAASFLDHIRHDIVSPSLEKDGWLYLSALDPENAQAFRRKFDMFELFVNEKRPPVL